MNLPCCFSNAHTHTTFCDGVNTAAEMAQAALEKGFHTLGFSGHSSLDGTGTDWTMQNIAAYKAEINRLKGQYAGRLHIACGIEWDLLSPPWQRTGFDYVIGSVHCLVGETTGQRYDIDNTEEILARCLADEFGGDGIAMAKHYYQQVKALLDTKPDILGHIDLIGKLNGQGRFFDETHPDYLQAAYSAIEKAARLGVLVEINTGGAYRGYRDGFYPSAPLLKHLCRLGGRVILTSDSHEAKSLGFGFEAALQLARQSGFQTVWYQNKNGFSVCQI